MAPLVADAGPEVAVQAELEVAGVKEVQALRAQLAFVELGLFVAIQCPVLHLQVEGVLLAVLFPMLFDQEMNGGGLDGRRIFGDS